MKIGEIFCALRSSESDEVLRARIPIFFFVLNKFMWVSSRGIRTTVYGRVKSFDSPAWHFWGFGDVRYLPFPVQPSFIEFSHDGSLDQILGS